jgi:hypothetical protein
VGTQTFLAMNPFTPFSQAGLGALSGIDSSEVEDGLDAVETYFECITSCSLDDAECVTVCTDKLRDHS